MSFVSERFLAFVLVVCILYYTLPKKWQPYLLLAASYAFYLFSGLKNLGFILTVTVSTYLGGLWLKHYADSRQAKMDNSETPLSREEKKAFRAKTQTGKQLIITAVMVLDFGILFVVKYAASFIGTANSVLAKVGTGARIPTLQILLPLGISFFTFQAVSYLLDVYRNKHQPEKNFLKYALFVSFFPQLVQGPIGRYELLSPQFSAEHRFDSNACKHAILLILWGYFKKVVIADNLAPFVAALFGGYLGQHGIQVFLAGAFYGLQIYGDFSGGIDVTRGVAKLFGIEMSENFNQPFFANTLSDFWRRWHITLGGWMRDYVFYPLALSKTFNNLGRWGKQKFGPEIGKVLPTCVIACINFLIIGIWHGPAFKYVAYGLYNGGLIALGTLTAPGFAVLFKKYGISTETKIYRLLQILRTIIFVTIGRIIAHADSFRIGMSMLKSMLLRSCAGTNWGEWFTQGGMTAALWWVVGIGIVAVFVRDVLVERGVDLYKKYDNTPVVLQMSWIILITMVILIFGVYGIAFNSGSFLYGGF